MVEETESSVSYLEGLCQRKNAVSECPSGGSFPPKKRHKQEKITFT